MCTCSSLSKNIILHLIFIFMIISEGNNKLLLSVDKYYCPYIETLSFGSDIDIKCNSSYLIFHEINSEGLNWKFSNQTSTCNQNGAQQAFVNQCSISRIGSNYLKVPLKSLENNEKACIYCRINYKRIAPLISVVQSDDGQDNFYIFNITANGLAHNESFEILWAKRVHETFRHSFNYWFFQGCIDPRVKILVNTPHTIVFATDDVIINRVEFIIRRCNGTCRKYNACQQQQSIKEIEPNYFPIPESIEKISCDSDCLNGIIKPPISAITHRPDEVSSTSSTTIKTPLKLEQKMKFIILIILIGISLIITLVIFIRCIPCKSKGKKHVYAKTNTIDLDEHK